MARSSPTPPPSASTPSSLYAGPQKQATANVTAQVSSVPPTPSTPAAIPAPGGARLLLASAGLGGLGALLARRRRAAPSKG